MGCRTLLLLLILMAFAVVQSQKDKKKGNSCTKKKIIEYTDEEQFSLLCGGKSYLVYNCSPTKDNPGNTKDFEGKYTRQDQCNKKKDSSKTSTNSHTVIGLCVVVALLSVLLLIVTGGWIWTCWILRKTTEISIKPKSSTRIIHQYDEHPLQPDNSTSFQPSVNYSLLNPKCDSHLSQSQLSRSEMEEEQIYEVLDVEDNHLQMAKARGVNRGVTISRDKNGPYSKLEYSENSQGN